MYQIKDANTKYNFHLTDVLDISPLLSVYDESIKKQHHRFRITLKTTIIRLNFYDKEIAEHELSKLKTALRLESEGVVNE